MFSAAWRNSWFQLASFALVISGALLVFDYAPHLTGLARPRPAPSSTASAPISSPAPAPSRADASSGDNPAVAAVSGKWKLQGLGCDFPVSISVSGELLSLTTAGKTSIAKIVQSKGAGVVEAQADDGAYRYALQPNGSLQVGGPGGMSMQLSRCGE